MDEPVAIIASGPSVRKEEINKLRNKMRVIAIKENVTLAPWADVVYGCDAAWWRNEIGLPKFTGLKIAYEPTEYKDICIVDINKNVDTILLGTTIGSGGNSGFQALNLAVNFNVNRILLMGYDMHDRSGVHWYGRANGPGRNNPCEDNFKRWRKAFINSTQILIDLGIDVVNVSPISDLYCYRKATVEQTLIDWDLA